MELESNVMKLKLNVISCLGLLICSGLTNELIVLSNIVVKDTGKTYIGMCILLVCICIYTQLFNYKIQKYNEFVILLYSILMWFVVGLLFGCIFNVFMYVLSMCFGLIY
jgi:hypothetical protein